MVVDFRRRWTGQHSRRPVPFERSYWVLDGLFLAGLYPGAPEEDESRRRVRALCDAGIRHILDLTEADELTWRGPLRHYEDLLEELAPDITWERFPIRDMDIAPKEVISVILESIDCHLERGEPVYLHCLGGLGRTGMIVGCWIVRHGFARGEAALHAISRLRGRALTGSVSPQTWNQCKVVREWV